MWAVGWSQENARWRQGYGGGQSVISMLDRRRWLVALRQRGRLCAKKVRDVPLKPENLSAAVEVLS